MNEQPEALRLAEHLELNATHRRGDDRHLAAAELRRLHEENERLRAAVAAEREKVAAWMRNNSYATGHGDTTEDLLKELEWQVAEESAELLQALQNLHQRCHWADAPEEMDAAKAVIEKAIRARNEQLREALKTYGQHRNNCAAVLGGYQCTCGFNQQEQTR